MQKIEYKVKNKKGLSLEDINISHFLSSWSNHTFYLGDDHLITFFVLINDKNYWVSITNITNWKNLGSFKVGLRTKTNISRIINNIKRIIEVQKIKLREDKHKITFDQDLHF